VLFAYLCAWLLSSSGSRHLAVADQPVGREQYGVYVEPVALTDTAGSLAAAINLGAIVADTGYADGLQAAADGWGLSLDLFVTRDPAERRKLANRLVAAGESLLIIQPVAGEDWEPVRRDAAERAIGFRMAQTVLTGFRAGFEDLKSARASFATRLPKHQEVMPIACPISPLPDTFFAPAGGPPMHPLVRSDRAAVTPSVPAHARVGSVMVAVVGNLLEHTSATDPGLLLLDLEGGLCSVRGPADATDPGRISPLVTGCQIAVRGPGGQERDVMVEGNGVDPIPFKPAVHAIDEFTAALEAWRKAGTITGYRHISDDSFELDGWKGRTRTVRCELFVRTAPDPVKTPTLTTVQGDSGRLVLEFTSTRRLVQRLVETGGPSTVLSSILQRLAVPAGERGVWLLRVEGGTLAVTPAGPLDPGDLARQVERIDLDLRGPLTSDQTVSVSLVGGARRVFRRTALRGPALDGALATLKGMGLVGGWAFEGVRGRGLEADLVLERFLGRHRRFMSSLVVRPSDGVASVPGIRWWVDDLQRLGFSLTTQDGWEQEFVEVPLRVVPTPRDVVMAPAAPPLP